MSASLRDRATRPTDQAPAGLGDTASVPSANKCACGKEISRWAVRCGPCHDQRIIDAATVVEPSAPMCIVGDETFYHDLGDAIELAGGQYAHPCFEEPLRVSRPKRTAADLVERVIEEMCEEAFEDAADYVKGEDDLRHAFEAAIEEFNAKQTASTWIPNTKEVFCIPASGIEAATADETRSGSTEGESPAPKGDAQ